jgi:hypothetical protein
MTGAWDAHRGSVETAIHLIGELQDAIAVVTDKQEVAHGAVIVAIGESQQDSAQFAAGAVAGVKEAAEQMYQTLENAKAELIRYAGGF